MIKNNFQEEIGFVCEPQTLSLLYSKESIIHELMNNNASESRQSEITGDVFVYFLQPLEDKIDFEKLLSVLDQNLEEIFYVSRTKDKIIKNGKYQSDFDFDILNDSFVFPKLD